MEKNLFIMELLNDLADGWNNSNGDSGFFFVAVSGDEWCVRGVGNQQLAAKKLAESAMEFESHAQFINDMAMAYLRGLKSNNEPAKQPGQPEQPEKGEEA